MRNVYVLLAVLLAAASVSAQTSTARVQVIHNAPAPTVDIYANGTKLLDNFAFRTATPFINIPAGVDIDLAVAPDTSTSARSAITTFDNVRFEEGKTYVVTAGGVVGDVATPFTLMVNDMGRESASFPAQVDLAVLHGSPRAPSVDVGLRLGPTLIPGLAYGRYSPYLSVDPGIYYLDVRASDQGPLVGTYKADLSGLAGKAATVFASGFLTTIPEFGLFAALADGTVVELPSTPLARVQIIHNSPSPTVDIYANGAKLLDNFAFRTATPYVDVPAEADIDLAVAPETSTSADDALAVFENVRFPNGATYQVIANGVVGEPLTPFSLVINTNAREKATADNMVDLIAFHGSPGAPPVDIHVRSQGNLITNLRYGTFAGYVTVEPKVYFLDVRPAGSGTIVATFKADLSALAGQSVMVFASGRLNGEPGFGLFAALADGTVVALPTDTGPTARVQIIHNAPSPTVDIYANGVKLLDNFTFRTATPYVDIPAGVDIDIAVAPDTSTSAASAIVTFENVQLAPGRVATIFANGVVGNALTPFQLVFNLDAREEAADPAKVDIIAFHGSPGAPAVDVDARGVGALITSLRYGGLSGYLSVDPGLYYLDVRLSGTSTILATFQADLRALAGQSVTLFASGFPLADPRFGLFAALADGTVVQLPVTPVARVQVIHNSPSPTVDIYANGEKLLDNFAFRSATPFVTLPAGVDIDLAVAPDTSSSVASAIATFENIRFENGKTYIVTANGVVGNPLTPFSLAVTDAARERAADPEKVDFAAFHGSPGAPAVDAVIRATDTGILNLSYGNYSAYQSVAPDVYYLDVRAAGTNAILATFKVDLSSLKGQSVMIFASGFLLDNPRFGLFAALADGTVIQLPLSPVARVQVIHNSPSPTVDIYANGEKLLDNFAFRKASPFVTLPAGIDIDLAVALDTSTSAGSALVTFDNVRFENGKTYVVIATGVVGNVQRPFNLAVYDMGREKATAQGIDLLLYHGSTDAPEVDVVVDGGPVLFDNIEYGEFQGYVNVPAGNYRLRLTPASDNATTVQTYVADLSGAAGAAATVFASGFLGGDAPGFEVWVALADGTTFALPTAPTSILQLGDKLDYMRVAPNPAADLIQLQYGLKDNLDLSLRIFDATGRLVGSQYLGRQQAGNYTQPLDLSGLPGGVYSLSLVSDRGVATQRIIVKR